MKGIEKLKKISKKKKIVMAAAAVIIIIAAVIVIKQTGGSSTDIKYNEMQVSRQDITSSYSYDGTISAKKSQVVYATGVNDVEKIYVEVGDQVQVGDMLVSYDSDNNSLTSAQASLSSAKLSVSNAQTALNRSSELYAIGAVSQEEYESAQNSLASAKIQLTQAQANYQTAADNQSDSQVTAELAGEVVSVSVDEGDSLTSGTEVMEIISNDSLEVEILIDEYDMEILNEGMEANVTVNSTGEIVKGTISELSKKATVTNGVSYFSGTISLEPSESLSVGISVEVSIIIGDIKDAIAVPITAIQYKDDFSTFVYMKGMKEQTVEVGGNNGTMAEITSGLSEGDTILVPETSDDSSNTMMPGMGGAPGGGGMPGGNGGGGPSGGGAGGGPM